MTQATEQRKIMSVEEVAEKLGVGKTVIEKGISNCLGVVLKSPLTQEQVEMIVSHYQKHKIHHRGPRKATEAPTAEEPSTTRQAELTRPVAAEEPVQVGFAITPKWWTGLPVRVDSRVPHMSQQTRIYGLVVGQAIDMVPSLEELQTAERILRELRRPEQYWTKVIRILEQRLEEAKTKMEVGELPYIRLMEKMPPSEVLQRREEPEIQGAA